MFSNFPSSYSYNIFAVYFSGNSFFLKSLSFIISNFSCLLTSILIFSLNSTIASFAFSKSSYFSQLSYSVVNLFHCTKYLTTYLTFLLFNIFSTFHSLTSSTSTDFTSSIFCPSIYSLYYTIWLIFTTEWILIKVGNHSSIVWVDTILLMII